MQIKCKETSGNMTEPIYFLLNNNLLCIQLSITKILLVLTIEFYHNNYF
jgi:hypothetical protein